MDGVEVTTSFLKGVLPATAGAVVLLVVLKRFTKKAKWSVPLLLLLSAIVALCVARNHPHNFRMMRHINGHLTLYQVLRVTTNWGIYASLLAVPLVDFISEVVRAKQIKKGTPNKPGLESRHSPTPSP